MDLSGLQQLEPIPQPRPRASRFIDDLALRCREIEERLGETEGYHILYGGIFGVMRARSITSADGDCLAITVVDSDGNESEIVAPLEQASFLFSIVSLKPHEECERVILGFAKTEADAVD